MSSQRLTRKKPRIGKLMLITAIATLFVAFVAFLFLLHGFELLAYGAAILPLLPFFAVAIFYLIKKEQAAAARVWGILGVFPLAFLSRIFVVGVISPFIFPFIMAIGGVVLALRRPKLAGGLMLASAIGGGAAFLVSIVAPGAGYTATLLLAICLLASSFLIPGGILALTSRKGQIASKKMVIGAIAAFFAPLVLWAGLYLLGF